LRHLPVTAIHHSPLRRAVQTAAAVSALLPEVPLMVSPLLSECIPGFPTEYAGHFTHLTAERIARDQAQVDAAFRTYVVPAGGPVVHDVIICHGNIIRALMMRVLRVSPERWVHAITHNGGISEVLIDTAGQPFLVSFNETSHLPADLRTH
jgi:probable phosphoglycerate mutase